MANHAPKDGDLVLVSPHVLDGAECLFAYRDRPRKSDSGWVLLAGDESDTTLGNATRFARRDIAWARELIPGFADIELAPPDTSLERESEDDPWVELEE
jgi:hypothetical protein